MPPEPVAARLRITVVIDNQIDIFLPAKGPWRYPLPGKNSSLWAEQGLSLWLAVWGSAGPPFKLLYDFGRSDQVLPHNMENLGLDPVQADLLVLSHGHIDHYGGLIRMLRGNSLTAPLVMHPSAFGERGIRLAGGALAGPWELRLEDLEPQLRAPLRFAHQPLHLAPGLWCSGTIERRSETDIPLSSAVRWHDGNEIHDQVEDDLALVICLKDKGLVVVTGCCHAGVVNTLDAAAALHPSQPLYALIGGFHLNHLNPQQVEEVAAEIIRREPRWVLPMHCTGAQAADILRRRLGDRCVYNTVGLTLDLGGE